MKLKAIFNSSFFLKIIFALSFFILIFISSVSYKHTIALDESTALLVHSYKIRIRLEQVLSYLKDAETGQRGFIISNDSVFLQPYISCRQKVDESFIILKALTANDKQQQSNLDSLHQLINLRFALLAYSLRMASEKGLNKILLDENMFTGKKVMDKIRTQINKMSDLENRYFREQQVKYEHEISFTPLFSLLFLLFSLTVFFFSYVKINKDFFVLRKSDKKLLITTESIKQAEVIGEFGISQWDIETNEIIYSDNLYKLLGFEPQSFEPTVENYLKFVHPDDRYIVADGTKVLVNDSKTDPRYYRIIRKDGALRYFMSMGKFISDNNGRKMYLGIIKDITPFHLSNLELEERNRELEQNNKELASFNHIASHDLQEPLRKIQTFISRISENELLTMSDTGKNYFAKVQASVNQMRKLIDDLLLFSRTNKTEKKFEKTDLNFLLEDVNQELSQDIEEKNAVIQCAKLPVLNVIPFQIKQLFVNLIGNSLKYSKPGISPVIIIDCEEVTGNEYPNLKIDRYKKYYKISVTDNGLGFEQQYAENIFILFHRLHHKNEYPGSGIGLSICKKIAENHNGFISAEGKPDIGSTFNVFFPI